MTAMNQVLKYAAYGIGSFTVLGGSFFMAAALSGTPMSAIPGVGGMFPEPVQPETKEEVQDLREELAQDRRSAGQVYGRARSPLQAFLLDNPFSAGELEQITEDLKAERRAVAMQETELEQLRAELVEDRQHYQDLFVELEELRELVDSRRTAVEDLVTKYAPKELVDYADEPEGDIYAEPALERIPARRKAVSE